MNNQKPFDRAVNLLLAGVVGSTGCITIVIVGFMILLGLWLDQQLDSSPAFTFICILGSAPVALTVTIITAVRLTKIIEKRQHGSSSSDESNQ